MPVGEDDLEAELADALDVERLATAIRKISGAFEKIAAHGGLASHTMVLLLHDYTKVPKKDIGKILNALPQLAAHYTQKGK